MTPSVPHRATNALICIAVKTNTDRRRHTMALRMMLGRKIVANAAPAATRSFRAAAVSMKLPTTEAEMDAYLAQPGNADLTADQIIAKLNAENPVASPASSGPDIVKEVFFDQQRKFRAFADKTKGLVPPVGGDDAAIEAYATKRNAILKEVRVYTFTFPSHRVLTRQKTPHQQRIYRIAYHHTALESRARGGSVSAVCRGCARSGHKKKIGFIFLLFFFF